MYCSLAAGEEASLQCFKYNFLPSSKFHLANNLKLSIGYSQSCNKDFPVQNKFQPNLSSIPCIGDISHLFINPVYYVHIPKFYNLQVIFFHH